MDDSTRDALHEWFLPRLIQAWDEGSVGSVNIDDDRYVQWAGYGLGLQIECVSNRFLDGRSRLTDAQVHELRRRGWQDPLGEDLPNHWQVFLDRDEVDKAARALVDVVQYLQGQPAASAAPRPARSVAVVPVGKVGSDYVWDTAVGVLPGLSKAVVFDLLGQALPEATLPGASTATVLEVGPLLTYPLLIQSGPSFVDAPIAQLMVAAGGLLGQMETLRAAGHDVLVIGPRLLPHVQQLYAAVLEAGADTVVLCLDDTKHWSLERDLLQGIAPAMRHASVVAVSGSPIAPEVHQVLGDGYALVAGTSARGGFATLEELVRALNEGRAPRLPREDDKGRTPLLPRTRAGKHEDGVEVLAVGAQGPHYVFPGTTCHSKEEFAELLRAWLDHPERQAVMGEPTTFGGRPLVHVWCGGRRFRLNGDTRDAGVREYLRLVEEQGPDLAWHVVANASGRVNKVAFGSPPVPVKYFYLYADEPSPEPYVI